MRRLDLLTEKERITAFIRDYLARSGKKKVVLGLSGGIDSAVIAALCTEALGNKNVYAAILPYRTSDPKNVVDARNLAKKLKIHHRDISITPYVDTYFSDNSPDASLLRKGNFMARIRMCILYDLSAFYDALVVGTGNRTELLTGYTTQYGDNACAFEPIGHLYKTEVRSLAKYLLIKEEIINKSPSADLWKGQTDEEEIGMSYLTLDEILYLMFDKEKTPEEIIKEGFLEEDVQRVTELHKESEFKRRLPEMLNGS
jgi:NAD+ synthase